MSDKQPSRLEVLDSELEALRTEIAELDSADEPTDEQAERFDAALAEWDTKKADRDRLAERQSKVALVREAALSPSNRESTQPTVPNVITRSDPFEGVESIQIRRDANDNHRMGSSDVIDRAKRAFEGGSRGMKADDLDALMERIETVPGAAEHALVHGSPAYRSAFESWVSAQGQNAVYTSEEGEAVRAALSLTGANGGYTLPTLLDPSLIKTGAASKNPIRRLATVVQGTQNVWHGVTAGAVTAYWTAEATAMTDGNPTFGNPDVPAHKITAYLPGSFEVFEDSALQSTLPALIAESFDYLESDAFVSGTGSVNPQGIATALTTSSRVAPTTGGAFSTASAADVFKLLNAIPTRFEDSSTWLANKDTFNTIKQMSTGSQGSYFWSDFNNAVGEGQGLLGSPVAKSSSMTNATTTGSVLIVLGDFSRYVVYDRIGTQVEFIQNVVNGDGLPTGQRALVAHKRVGGDVTDTNAFRMLKL